MSLHETPRDDGRPRRVEHPRPQESYKFTAEEMRVIKECNQESFYQRCLPIGSLMGLSTYYGVKAGYFRPSPRFGAIPKVTVAIVVGYFLGKFSYQNKCAEKLMKLPNSQIGEMLRKRRKGTFQETLEPRFGPGMSLAPFSGITSSDTYTDLNSNSSLDMDTSRPQFEGLDDSHRPSVDSTIYPIYEEEMPPVQKQVTSYDELRKKNREEYQQRRTGNHNYLTKPATPPQPPLQQSEQNAGPKNQYGDIWEK